MCNNEMNPLARLLDGIPRMPAREDFENLSCNDQLCYLRGVVDTLKMSASTPFEKQAAEVLSKMNDVLIHSMEITLTTGAAVCCSMERLDVLESVCGIDYGSDEDDEDEVDCEGCPLADECPSYEARMEEGEDDEDGEDCPHAGHCHHRETDEDDD